MWAGHTHPQSSCGGSIGGGQHARIGLTPRIYQGDGAGSVDHGKLGEIEKLRGIPLAGSGAPVVRVLPLCGCGAPTALRTMGSDSSGRFRD